MREIILALADAEVEFVIGGGVACVLQGVERFTMDLDIAINLTPENLKRFVAVMKEQHLTPRVPVPPEALLNPDAVKMMVEEKHALVFTFLDVNNPMRHVDVFLRDDLSYDVLNRHSEAVDLGERSIKLVSRAKLLAIKEAITPPRDKDQLDIAALRRMIHDE
ncbi:MAG: hypothetical protein ISR85_07215 [Kiritimatiellales bacterium]|nr:hypothetical protein [Kiritimatiellales bacterium]